MENKSNKPSFLYILVNLAAPQTWAASIIPVLIGVCLAYHCTHTLHPIICILLLFISILMQSSVNALNDYFDCIKKVDSKDDNLEIDDAVLINFEVEPKIAKYTAIGFLIVAFILGLPIIYFAGLIPLVIALIGALIVFLYSGTNTPISYLPISEIVSGFVMGILICLASFISLTNTPLISYEMLFVLLCSIPQFFGIALIMMTNNISDIEKDIKANRHTLPSIIGREKAIVIYKTLLVIWMLSIAVLVLIFFTESWVFLLFMLCCSLALLMRIFKSNLLPSNRIISMGNISTLNLIFGIMFALCILL